MPPLPPRSRGGRSAEPRSVEPRRQRAAKAPKDHGPVQLSCFILCAAERWTRRETRNKELLSVTTAPGCRLDVATPEHAMTSISASSRNGFSPLDLLKQELPKEVSAGKVGATDQTTLSSALDDIDSALKGGSSGTSASKGSSTPPSHAEMQSKIDDLIQGEVDSGKLSSDQAGELKNVFASAFSGGPGGARGAGGPPPPPPSDESSDTSSSSSSSSTASDVEELLKKLLDSLQSSNSKTSSYGANGTSSSSSSSK